MTSASESDMELELSDSELKLITKSEKELDAALACQLILNSRLKWQIVRALLMSKLNWIVSQVKDMESAGHRFVEVLYNMALTDSRKKMLITNGVILVKCNKLDEKIAAAIDNIKSVEHFMWVGPLPKETDFLQMTTAEKDLIANKWKEGEMIIKNFSTILDTLKAEWEQLEEIGKEIKTLMNDPEIRSKGDYDKYI